MEYNLGSAGPGPKIRGGRPVGLAKQNPFGEDKCSLGNSGLGPGPGLGFGP